jgi:single-strand DNA-binding protein
MSVNKVILIGRLGKDPEGKHSSSGVTIVNFSIATSERFKDQSGEWTTKAEWHNIVCFGKTAENALNYLAKGSECYIEGKLQTSSWDDKEGNKKYKTEIVANTIQFLGGKKEPVQSTAKQIADILDQQLGLASRLQIDMDDDQIPFD